MTPDGLAPPPTTAAGRSTVAAELESLDATVTFDVARREARVEAAMSFRAGPATTEGPVAVAFDLRQPVDGGRLDDRAVALRRVDLGGGEGAEMLVLDELVEGRTSHLLELSYRLATPSVVDPLPVAWTADGVQWDLWCSDIYPGRYLEQWLPVGLCQDEFALTLDVEIVGAATAHTVVANGAVQRGGDQSWRIAWPAHHTSLSSMLVIAPSSALRMATTMTGGVTVEMAVAGGIDEPAAELAERAAGFVSANTAAVGPYEHGGRFVGYVWASTRGMEYDGATTSSVSALSHEVFHSWWGRGVKPASANDGWIDEAYTTWTTSDHEEFPRLACRELGLDDDPVVLAPRSPWSRRTPREAYRTGYRLFAHLASVAGVDGVQQAMATLYRRHKGGFITTDELRDELSELLSFDAGPWWRRYVRGEA